MNHLRNNGRAVNESAADSGVAGSRPREPDQEILDAASRSLSQRLGLSINKSWAVLDRFDRPRSTVFRLCNPGIDRNIQIFYKAYFLPGEAGISQSSRIERYRQALLVESHLANKLQPALAKESIRFDEPLALDPQRLVAVRLGISGRQLGRALNYAMPGRRGNPRNVYRKIGLALRIIEQVGSVPPNPRSISRVELAIPKDLDRSAHYLSALERASNPIASRLLLGVYRNRKGVRMDAWRR